MYLDQLDEAEGLTLKMVIDYAIERCWRTQPNGAGERLLLPDGTQSYAADDPLFLVARIAEHERTTAQELLRRVNPRMAPGWPSEEELQRHAWWLIGQPALRVDLRVTTAKHVRAWRDRSDPEWAQVLCWPCDARGNKVRRGPR